MKLISTTPFAVIAIVFVSSAFYIGPAGSPDIMGLFCVGMLVALSAFFALANLRERWYIPLAICWLGAAVSTAISVFPVAALSTAHSIPYGFFGSLVALYPIFFGFWVFGASLVFGLGWHAFGKGMLNRTKQCESCGKQVSAGTNYCPYCGTIR
jgi:hypothetical protein